MDREFPLEKKKKKDYSHIMECERILYIIFDKKTFFNYGLPRTIRFTRTFDKLDDALSYYRRLEDYERYIFTVVTLSEYLELKERYK